MSTPINIQTIHKADVLKALFNHAKPQGLGMLHYQDRTMSTYEAQQILEASSGYFDYVQGRVIKADLNGNMLDPTLYDRDNGEGAARAALYEHGLIDDNDWLDSPIV